MSTGAQIKADSVITGECGNVMDTRLKKFETANKKPQMRGRPPHTVPCNSWNTVPAPSMSGSIPVIA
ncbi:hypothetical protein DS909_16325 [Phaeobacter gallaeciensis]|uniref:Uncharacterized protein n=1 Tax=Phaeobacter gallaeciensis TaxID=60890 RepID=A0A366WXE9_9RHOB|nr:hypothetical protein DS909_16325 [Phaeobacter gallaeciensis]